MELAIMLECLIFQQLSKYAFDELFKFTVWSATELLWNSLLIMHCKYYDY